jgi:hypothetical protein
MGVEIDKAGRDNAAGSIDDGSLRRLRKVRGHSGDPTLLDQDICRPIEAGGWVDDTTMKDEERTILGAVHK